MEPLETLSPPLIPQEGDSNPLARAQYETLSHNTELAAGYMYTSIGVKGQHLGLGGTSRNLESPFKHQNSLLHVTITMLEVLCCLLIPVQHRSTHLLKTSSTPVIPIPSTMSLVNLNGTVSGVGRILPCSKATPK